MRYKFRCVVIFFLGISLSAVSMENENIPENEGSILQTISDFYAQHPKAMKMCIDVALLGIGWKLGGGRLLHAMMKTSNDEQLAKIFQASPEAAKYGALLVGGTCVSLLVQGGSECHRLLEQCTDIEGIDD